MAKPLKKRLVKRTRLCNRTTQPTTDPTNDNGESPVSILQESGFLAFIFAITLALILVSLWQRVVENLFFRYGPYSQNSVVDTFIVAVTLTVIFFVIIWVVDYYNVFSGLSFRVEGQSTLGL